MGLSGSQVSVMLLLCSRMETDGGGTWFGWYPRSKIAETLGMSERTVADIMTKLKRKGAISTRGKAFSGRCQTYWLMPGEKGIALGKPKSQKGSSAQQTHYVKGSAAEREKGLPQDVKRVGSTLYPLRRKKKEGASTAPSVEGRPSASEGVGYRRAVPTV